MVSIPGEEKSGRKFYKEEQSNSVSSRTRRPKVTAERESRKPETPNANQTNQTSDKGQKVEENRTKVEGPG